MTTLSYAHRMDRFTTIVWIAGAALALLSCDAMPQTSQRSKQPGSGAPRSILLKDPRSGLVFEDGPLWRAGGSEPRGPNDFSSRRQWRAWAKPAWTKTCRDLVVKTVLGRVPRQGRAYRRLQGLGEVPIDLLAGKGVLLADGFTIPVVWVWSDWPDEKGDPLAYKEQRFTIARSPGVALWRIWPHPILHEGPVWSDDVVRTCDNLSAHLDG